MLPELIEFFSSLDLAGDISPKSVAARLGLNTSEAIETGDKTKALLGARRDRFSFDLFSGRVRGPSITMLISPPCPAPFDVRSHVFGLDQHMTDSSTGQGFSIAFRTTHEIILTSPVGSNSVDSVCARRLE